MAKVLLVEDDNNLREIYEARLQAEGYNIVSAKDGEEALVVAKEEQPDLIISDVMMPKISGFEMLDILRNTAGLKDTKVIMLTALGQAEDQTRANKLGADRYLVKSQVTLEDIVKVSHELLGETEGDAANEPAPQPEATQVAPETQAPTVSEQPVPVAQPPEPVTQPPAPSEAPQPAPAPIVDATPPVTPAPVTLAPAPEPATPADPVQVDTPQPVPLSVPVEPPQLQPVPTAAAPVTDDSTASTSTNEESQIDTQASTSETSTPAEPSAEIAIDESGQLSQTEAEENATMDQQIAEFLKNTPASPDVAAPVETVPEAVPSAPQAPAPDAPAAQAANDQTLAQAVNNLMEVEPGVTPAKETPSLVQPTITPPAPVVSSTEPAPVVQPNQAKPAVEENATGGNRVVQPLGAKPQKSLNDLLAQEEALEKAQQQMNGTQAPTQKPFDPSDPNSIAL